MAFTTKIDSAYYLKKEFGEYGRDDYPDEVYEALIKYSEYMGDIELDVIGLCSEITFTEFDSNCYDDILEETLILYIDESEEKIWHFSY